MPIHRVTQDGIFEAEDSLAAEEPLEIVIAFGALHQRRRQSISVTMRTPTGHDFELALIGETSEYVEDTIEDGTFGMIEETGSMLNAAIKEGAKNNLGMGFAIGKKIDELNLPNKEFSILYNAYKMKIPLTVHSAIGTDIIHQHPSCDGAAIGKTSYNDFRLFADSVSKKYDELRNLNDSLRLKAVGKYEVELLKRYNIPTEGKHCVVLGRSNIVGGPMSILMSRKGNPGNCTVTLVHSKTQNLKEELLRADIIIAAIGIPKFVKSDMVKEGVIILDVGINRIADATKKSGFVLVGDVDFEEVASKCSFISPVPGGVGPMTVTALMLNTLRASRNEIYE